MVRITLSYDSLTDDQRFALLLVCAHSNGHCILRDPEHHNNTVVTFMFPHDSGLVVDYLDSLNVTFNAHLVGPGAQAMFYHEDGGHVQTHWFDQKALDKIKIPVMPWQ
jgi:hypothetical protein